MFSGVLQAVPHHRRICGVQLVSPFSPRRCVWDSPIERREFDDLRAAVIGNKVLPLQTSPRAGEKRADHARPVPGQGRNDTFLMRAHLAHSSDGVNAVLVALSRPSSARWGTPEYNPIARDRKPRTRQFPRPLHPSVVQGSHKDRTGLRRTSHALPSVKLTHYRIGDDADGFAAAGANGLSRAWCRTQVKPARVPPHPVGLDRSSGVP